MQNKRKLRYTKEYFGLIINNNLLILSKVVNFKRISLALAKAGRSWENIGPAIGLTGNGMRYTINNKSLTLVKYTELCKELKIHPAFVFLEEEELDEMFYKKSIKEVEFGHAAYLRLKAEHEKLKEKNSQLQTRLIELLDTKV